VNWQTAVEREQLVRKSLEEATSEGMKLNEAATEYTAMRQETDSSHELYTRVLERVEEAGLSAGIHASNISVVDYARPPVKPAAPDLPLYMAITFFAGLWLAVGGALMMESIHPSVTRAAAVLLAVLVAGGLAHAQAPTPSTSGLPTGVASFPQTPETKSLPNPKEAPLLWTSPAGAAQTGAPPLAVPQSALPMPAPIAPGDFLDVSEYHTPEFHSLVRVSEEGTVTLPMIGEIKVSGMDELQAAHTVEAALVAKGMLLHPLVTVLVTAYAGEDVSVLGEVARPGVYPYSYHHRLLDLIAAASGLTPNAGRLVNIFHASDPKTPHPVVLDPSGTDISSNHNPELLPNGTEATSDHNPELLPGDTVQVSRAGLVYVVGDVIRPGGFPVDPVQGLTVVQALALAWGPSQNAALTKAVLIRELHGQDPDQQVHDRDIIYVPDSVAKNLVNRTLESAIQSTIGVTIYSALVYSQRY
jgi:polysaccharide export outer membrane protein